MYTVLVHDGDHCYRGTLISILRSAMGDEALVLVAGVECWFGLYQIERVA